jgi:DNA-binding CsgD family transcriptional regulator
MSKAAEQQPLFGDAEPDSRCRITINDICYLHVEGDSRVVVIHGMPVMPYQGSDRALRAYVMLSLVEQGWATQQQVAQAFECTDRTVRRHKQRFEQGGLSALGRPSGYPRGRPRLSSQRTEQVQAWKAAGESNREIARKLGVTEKAVRKQLRRLGWRQEEAHQGELFDQAADPKVSAPSAVSTAGPSQQLLSTSSAPPGENAADENEMLDADPKVSAPEAPEPRGAPVSFDVDPSDRSGDRVLACLGLLDDAAPIFRSGSKVAGAGVLLAVPALVDSKFLDIAREVYGSIGPAFYGLRTTLMVFTLMALLRVRRPEGLKERSPAEMGRLVGLDRFPEVKTSRRKIARLAALKRSAEFGRALARHRVETRGPAMGFLYVDGHVRAYHGKRKLPKTHVARMRLSMPATTDYWVNDAEGEPLFVVTTEAHKGLVKMLPKILKEVRELVGERRVTIVFDRGGYSPKLFKKLIAAGFDILTYRKGRFRKVAKSQFVKHEATIDGQKLSYLLADQNVLLDRRSLKLRQVTRLSEDGHQTPILTSRIDLSTIEVAYRMFGRWRQENFFKYMREEFAIDVLVDYGTEPADSNRDVPNPQRKKVDAELKKAKAEVEQVLAVYGVEAFSNEEARRPTMRGFKIANAELTKRLEDGMKRVVDLEKKRAATPLRVPVQAVTDGEVIKLNVETKRVTDLLKMVAYQAESDLVRLIAPHYQRTEREGRTLIQSALAATGDIQVEGDTLHVRLEPLSSPHRTQVLVALCEDLNSTRTFFPGAGMRLHYEVKAAPEGTMAFPGPRPNRES